MRKQAYSVIFDGLSLTLKERSIMRNKVIGCTVHGALYCTSSRISNSVIEDLAEKVRETMLLCLKLAPVVWAKIETHLTLYLESQSHNTINYDKAEILFNLCWNLLKEVLMHKNISKRICFQIPFIFHLFPIYKSEHIAGSFPHRALNILLFPCYVGFFGIFLFIVLHPLQIKTFCYSTVFCILIK